MSEELIECLRAVVSTAHARGCQGRYYLCECGYDDRVNKALAELLVHVESDAAPKASTPTKFSSGPSQEGAAGSDAAPPQDVIDAALLVGCWFNEHGHEKWSLGYCASRAERDALAERAEKLHEALRELRESSHAYATIMLPSQGEAEYEWTRFCEALRSSDSALAAPSAP